jgi:hypothetical protein
MRNKCRVRKEKSSSLRRRPARSVAERAKSYLDRNAVFITAFAEAKRVSRCRENE